MTRTNKAGQTIAQEAPAGSSDTVGFSVPTDGTIEGLQLRIYNGAENTLQLVPEVHRDGATELLLELAGKAYVDGDDDVWSWDLSEPVEADDEIVIRYTNTDDTNPHNFRATMEVDYLSGTDRVVSVLQELTHRITGVL